MSSQGYYIPNTTGVPFTNDSVPPGGFKEGFGLRSPFLPGVREFDAEPTLTSCCSHPEPGSNEYPSPLAFRVTSLTVAPSVRPQDMRLNVLQDDLEKACSLHWITELAVCSSLLASLERILDVRARGDAPTTRDRLNAWIAELESQHGVGKPVNENAYWLLKVNAEYLAIHH